MPFPYNTLFNADAVKVDDECILFALLEEVNGVYFLALRRSKNVFHFKFYDEPTLDSQLRRIHIVHMRH
jgi:hypothetical protein